MSLFIPSNLSCFEKNPLIVFSQYSKFSKGRIAISYQNIRKTNTVELFGPSRLERIFI